MDDTVLRTSRGRLDSIKLINGIERQGLNRVFMKVQGDFICSHSGLQQMANYLCSGNRGSSFIRKENHAILGTGSVGAMY